MTDSWDLREWWAEQHRNKTLDKLSDNTGETVWATLGVSAIIVPKLKVLNVGIGTGRCTMSLCIRGCHVWALDICQEAVTKVQQITKGCHTSPAELPESLFDLAIHYLTAQHMDDAALGEQLNHIFRSLVPGGMLAMQYANGSVAQNNAATTEEMLKGGYRCRWPDIISNLIHDNGGSVIHQTGIDQYADYGWQRVHAIKRRGGVKHGDS